MIQVRRKISSSRPEAVRAVAPSWVTVIFLAVGVGIFSVSLQGGGYGRLLAAEPKESKPSAEDLAKVILDEAKEDSEREALIQKHPELSADLITTMARGLGAGDKEEYRRIPWIWRVAIAAGRRNDEAELHQLLKISIPAENASLTHWQAVVIGGGLINGVTQAGAWPAARIDAILGTDSNLASLWRRTLALASEMADNPKVPSGTRYDALRILGTSPWDQHGAQLFRYLTKGTHPELQQGAISALGDVPSPAVPQALLSGVEHYSEGNRKLLIEALLRDEARREALLDALTSGRITRADLGREVEQRLCDPTFNRSHERAKSLLAK